MRGFSRSNLFYMRAFAAAWDLSQDDVRSRVGMLPWRHIVELLKLKDPEIRDWYAERAREHNWKLEVLERQVATELHRRLGAAQITSKHVCLRTVLSWPGMSPKTRWSLISLG
jgi:hypothetical protein